MKQSVFTVTANEKIAANTYRMTLEGDTSAITKAGQFVNIKLEGFFLRRPISVYDCDEGKLGLIYKAVGKGTEYMAGLEKGAELDILTGLGNGYNLSKSGERPLLIGGGAGVPPMYNLCRRLIAEGKKPIVVMGFNKAYEIFCKEEFEKLGAEVIIATADGSVGVKGFVTDAIKDIDYTYVYTCGPEPMLKAVYNTIKTSGQFSFEERMGCGFGACMGCSCETKYGNKRICKDGPVLEKEEIIW